MENNESPCYYTSFSIFTKFVGTLNFFSINRANSCTPNFSVLWCQALMKERKRIVIPLVPRSLRINTIEHKDRSNYARIRACWMIRARIKARRAIFFAHGSKRGSSIPKLVKPFPASYFSILFSPEAS